jgi:hypothetical protein
MAEMSRLCTVCDISMLEPGTADGVLNGDESVCGRKNPAIFGKLRKHLMAFYTLEEKAIARLGPEEVQKILDDARDPIVRLRSAR